MIVFNIEGELYDDQVCLTKSNILDKSKPRSCLLCKHFVYKLFHTDALFHSHKITTHIFFIEFRYKE